MKKHLTVISLFIITFSYGQHYVLYGTAAQGGSAGYGTMFSYDLTTGKDSTLINFTGPNGLNPYSNLLPDYKNGLLYGTASGGGPGSNGVLFSYNPLTNKDSIVFAFNNTNGSSPGFGSLTFYNNSIYGMTQGGGLYGYGAVFRYDPATGLDTVPFNFYAAPLDAYDPNGSYLYPYSMRRWYGMTRTGGANNMGDIMYFDPVTSEDTIAFDLDSAHGYKVQNGNLSLNPKNGWLYGMAFLGGKYNKGVLFAFNPVTWKDSVQVNFSGTNGALPNGGLMYDTANGLFYGMTAHGGTANYGVLFSFNPVTGKDSVLLSFTGANGETPTGDVILGPGNKLYGLTTNSTIIGQSVLFSFDIATGKDSVLFSFPYAYQGEGASESLTLVDLGLITAAHDIMPSFQNMQVFPNPFTLSIHIVFNDNGKHYIEVDDVTGRKLQIIECSGKQYELNRNGLAPGVYFIRSYDEGRKAIVGTKIIVE